MPQAEHALRVLDCSVLARELTFNIRLNLNLMTGLFGCKYVENGSRITVLQPSVTVA